MFTDGRALRFPSGTYFRHWGASTLSTCLRCKTTDIGVFAARHGRASAVAMGVVARSQRTVTHRARSIHAHARTHARVHTATSMTRDTFYIYGTSVARASSSRSSIVFRCFPRDTLYPGTCKFKFGAILTKMTILSRS